LQQVPEDLHRAFIKALINQYLSMYPAGTNGAIHTGMVRLEVEAKKDSPVLRVSLGMF